MGEYSVAGEWIGFPVALLAAHTQSSAGYASPKALPEPVVFAEGSARR